MKVVLTLNESQADVLIDALDFYSRILMGQIGEITTIFPYGSITRNARVDSLISMLKREMFPELEDGSYFAAHEPRVGNGRVAYDIQQVLRHAIAWEHHPSGGIQVIFDNPLRCSDEPFPIVSIEKNKVSDQWKNCRS